MRDLKKDLKQKSKSISTYKHKLKLKLTGEEYIYCCVEGDEDKIFYYNKLQIFEEDKKLKFINCKGKTNVVQLHHAFYESPILQTYNVLFFVDKDYENPIEYSTIFTTDAYSIENYFVSYKVLEAILEYNFGLEDDVIIKKIISHYQSLQDNYHDLSMDINAFLKLQQIKGNSKENNKKLNIDKLKLKDIFDINLENITIKKNLEDCKKMLNDYYEYNELEFNNILRSFEEGNYIYDFRGKNEMYFFKKYMMLLQRELGKKNNIFGFKKTMSGNQDDLINKYVQYAEIPKNLNTYYKQMMK